MSTQDEFACKCPPAGELYLGATRLCTRPGCPVHDPATTQDEARELAKRWAFNEAGAPAYGADAICEPEPLDDAERERLFAWVLGVIAADGTQVMETIDYHQAACVVCAALGVADDTEWVRGLLDAALARPS